MASRVTLRDIAVRAGLSVSAVSLALRGHRSIPETTRERLRVLAKEMGYEPDPVLAALVAHRFQRKPAAFHGVIAWIDAWPEEGRARRQYHQHWAGAKAQAAAMGWKLEEFWLRAPGMTDRRAGEILRSRGVMGLLFPPLPQPGSALELDFARFSAVALTFTLQTPRLHRVVPSPYENMRMALGRIKDLGYRRPGLMIPEAIDARTNNYLSAAILEDYSRNRMREPIPPLIHSDLEAGDLHSWYQEHRPDVIITYDAEWAEDRLLELGLRVPADVGLVAGTRLRTNSRNFTYVDECFETVGARAVELVVKLIAQNEKGVPALHMDMSIEGTWCEGRSTRRQVQRVKRGGPALR